jgi:hypothetical protein
VVGPACGLLAAEVWCDQTPFRGSTKLLPPAPLLCLQYSPGLRLTQINADGVRTFKLERHRRHRLKLWPVCDRDFETALVSATRHNRLLLAQDRDDPLFRDGGYRVNSGRDFGLPLAESRTGSKSTDKKSRQRQPMLHMAF